ncbi:hypothetical protein [Bacillus mycoides]|uniref:hypothetical protein n=1 Tax=Bacillus mycoides TaxID=1405 RepID=UPI002111ADEB|nr:hypothetical protein [Bacillus mycoides]MCQ6530527.1 hypothetical protein [Bacillus mycoides]
MSKLNGIIKTVQIKEEYTKIMNATARDKSISNGARGLLLYIISLPSDYKIQKTKLYTEFEGEGRRVIERYLKELEEAGYFFEIPFRLGKHNKPIYYMSAMKLTDEIKKECYEEAVSSMIEESNEESLNLWGVQYEHLNMNSSKCTYIKLNNVLNKKVLKRKDSSDRYSKLSFTSLSNIIEKIKRQYKNLLTKKNLNAVVDNVIDAYDMSFEEGNEIIKDFEKYLVASMKTKIEQETKKKERAAKRKTKKEEQKKVNPPRKKVIRSEMVPDWVGEDEQTVEDKGLATEEDRKRLEEVLKKYKRD